MRRILTVMTVAAIMAAMLVSTALPALASSCVAEIVTPQVGPGEGNTFGQVVAGDAQSERPLGRTIVAPSAQGEVCP
jgi:hypothetical protein